MTRRRSVADIRAGGVKTLTDHELAWLCDLAQTAESMLRGRSSRTVPLSKCSGGMHFFPSHRHYCMCNKWRLPYADGWFTEEGLAKEPDAERVNLRTDKA